MHIPVQRVSRLGRGIVHAIDPHVDDHRPGLEHVAGDELRVRDPVALRVRGGLLDGLGRITDLVEAIAPDYPTVITGIRPANVTGPDKVRGSVDHVNVVTRPARGEAVTFPFADAMRCPIHVDDIAEVFVRVLMADKPKHQIYNSGGHAISMGDIAAIVRGFLPDAKISFEKETGGKASSGNYLIDNTRLVSEFGVQYRAYPERVLQIINDGRADQGLPPIKG